MLTRASHARAQGHRPRADAGRHGVALGKAQPSRPLFSTSNGLPWPTLVPKRRVSSQPLRQAGRCPPKSLELAGVTGERAGDGRPPGSSGLLQRTRRGPAHGARVQFRERRRGDSSGGWTDAARRAGGHQQSAAAPLGAGNGDGLCRRLREPASGTACGACAVPSPGCAVCHGGRGD